MARALLVAGVAVGLLAPASAAAAERFVGVSTPGASDAGPCTDASAPCATIQAAIDKSGAAGGRAVRVLANPDGKTTDSYVETVVSDGSAPVALIGAGGRANGTRLAPTGGCP